MTKDEIFALPHLPVSQRMRLPIQPGVYFLARESEILYVGSTQNLAQRCLFHHIIKKWMGSDYRIYYLIVLRRDGSYKRIEKTCIENFLPPLNKIRNLPDRSESAILQFRDQKIKYSLQVEIKDMVNEMVANLPNNADLLRKIINKLNEIDIEIIKEEEFGIKSKRGK